MNTALQCKHFLSILRTVLGLAIGFLFFIVPQFVYSQTAVPWGGLGSVQFFDNSGNLLTAGVVYFFAPGTTTQIPVYTDSTGLITQPNPVTFGSGARASIWFPSGSTIKAVLCVQNDGAFCAAGDILFSADNVLVSGGGSGGGASCSSGCTGFFVSGTASPATSGALRVASGDSICWRNAAGSANLCFKKDSNDLLSWDGGSFKLPEVGAPSGVTGFDIFWADNTAHRLKATNNAGTAAQYVLSGNDIGTTDQVLGVHFGATQQTFGNTALVTGQVIGYNGTNLVPVSGPGISAAVNLTTQAANCAVQTLTTPAANGWYRVAATIEITQAATTSSATPGLLLGYTSGDSSVAQSTTILSTNATNTVGNYDSVAFQASSLGFFAKSGVAITLTCSGYSSTGATPMQYALHARLEGPF